MDLWFGPRTWHRDLSNYFLNYNGEYGDKWECIYIPIINALMDKKRILGIEVNYINPPEQTAIEEHNLSYYQKRLEQLENLTKSITAHWEKHSQKKIIPCYKS